MILLQATGGTLYSTIFMWVAVLAVFYLFFIRPQQKKQKEQIQFLSNLDKGAQVVTASGIIGKINKIEDQIITLQVDSKTFIKITKSSLSKELTEAHSKNDLKIEGNS